MEKSLRKNIYIYTQTHTYIYTNIKLNHFAVYLKLYLYLNKKIKGQDLIRKKKTQFCWEKGGEVGL